MEITVRQAVTLQTIEVHDGADNHLQSVEDPMPEQGDLPYVKLKHVESSC